MNYNNCVEQSPTTGGAVNARYQAPSQSTQGVSHSPSGVNGINVMGPLCAGGGNVGGPGSGPGPGPGGGINYPIPVGHQTDLTFIMSLVEELSKVLHTNQNLTTGVVERIGKVREKAMHMNLQNDELLMEVAENLNRMCQLPSFLLTLLLLDRSLLLLLSFSVITIFLLPTLN